MSLILLASLALLLASAFFSGSESAMIGASRLHLAAEAERGRRRAARALTLLADPEHLFSLLLLGNNLANIALAALVTAAAGDLTAGWGPLTSTLIVAPVVLVFGEVVPKTLGLRQADRTAVLVAPLLALLARIAGPVVRLLAALARRLSPGGPAGSGSGGGIRSREELRLLLELAGEREEISEEERRTAYRVFDFGEKTAQSAMIPLVDVVALPLSATLEQAAELVRQTSYSKIPVYDGRIDNLVGIVHAKDLLVASAEVRLARQLLRPIPYVPATQSLLDLMATLQRERREMAFVVDEYGAAAGIITIEDLLEEIVGEIEDEFDAPEASEIEPDGEGGFSASGRVEIEAFEDLAGVRLPRGPYETLAGLVIARLGHIPEAGERASAAGFEFEVVEADGRRIRRLRARRQSPAA